MHPRKLSFPLFLATFVQLYRKNRTLHMLKNITYLEISPEDMKNQGKYTILQLLPVGAGVGI